jgi:hypothetical protein
LRRSRRVSALRVAESGSAIRIRIIRTSLVVYDERGPLVSDSGGVFSLSDWIGDFHPASGKFTI